MGFFPCHKDFLIPQNNQCEEYEQMITDMTTSVTISRPAARHRRQKSLKRAGDSSVQRTVFLMPRCPRYLQVHSRKREHVRCCLKSRHVRRVLFARGRRGAHVGAAFAHNYPPAPGKKQRTCVVPSVSKYGHTTAGPKRFGSVTTVSSGTGTHSP